MQLLICLSALLYLVHLSVCVRATCGPALSLLPPSGHRQGLTYDEALHFLSQRALSDGMDLNSSTLRDGECRHDDVVCVLRGGANKKRHKMEAGVSKKSEDDLTCVRGGAKKRKTKVPPTKKSREEEEEGGEEEEEGGAEGQETARYVPSKKKSLLQMSFNFIYSQLYGIIAPFLPRSVSKKLRLNPSSSDSSATSSSTKKGEKVSRTQLTQEHLEKSFTKGDSNARIQKELRSFLTNPPDNCKLIVGSNMRNWVVQITGADGTIYEGEKYKLRILFPKEYPTKPPSVYFLKPTPRHVHVYSNGDICLNLLGKDWRPQMSAQLLVVSILSMLSSAREKKIPPDNAMHADNAPGQPQTSWMYHDDRS